LPIIVKEDNLQKLIFPWKYSHVQDDFAPLSPDAWRTRKSAPPQLDDRVLEELVRNPEAAQLVLDYMEKKGKAKSVRR
jgi:hypothetical protein